MPARFSAHLTRSFALRALFRWFLRFGLVRAWRYRPALRLHSRAREELSRPGPPRIAVTDLMARYTPEQHLARADDYFVREDEEAALFRRPFQSAEDAQPRLAGLAAVLQLLQLEPGMTVLDFGCGTGWLGLSLATMGADVLATDVSERALALGRKFAARNPLAGELRLQFERFDGARLPAGDSRFDRIVSFDAFHHVFDQRATLGEMARVLKPGGIAVFHEPGPDHSQTPAAQFEMRQFDVIENDIDVHAIWAHAQAFGFDRLRMGLPALRMPEVRLSDYDRIAAGRPSMPDLRDAMQNIFEFSYNLRVFALHKAAS